MASPVVPPSIESSGLAALRENAGAGTTVPAQEFDTSQPAVPETPVGSTTQPAQADTPQKPPETPLEVKPQEPVKPAFDVKSPSVRKFLEELGADLSKPETWETALEKALTPREVPSEPIPAERPVEVTYEQVQPYLEKLTKEDPECMQFAQARWDALQRMQAIGIDPAGNYLPSGEIRSLQDEIQIAKLRLQIPEVKADSFQAAELLSDIDRKELMIERKHAEYARLERTIERAENGWRQKAENYRDQITTRLQARQSEQAEQAKYESDYKAALTNTPKLFKEAFDRAISKHKIPDHAKGSFERFAKLESIARTHDADIDNWDALLDELAPQHADMLDQHHRAQAAIYSQQKRETVAQPGPTPAQSVAGTTPQPKRSGDPIMGLMSDGLARLRQIAKGA